MVQVKRVLNIENLISLVKLLLAVVAATATILVFYFTMESKQDDKITENRVTLKDHLDDSKEAFENLNQTMREQRIANEAMSRTVVEVSTVQHIIKEENGRLAISIERQAEEVRKLAQEIRKSNGHTP